jgi:hypothetical protein
LLTNFIKMRSKRPGRAAAGRRSSLISALSGRRRFPVDFKVHDVEDYAALMASLRLPDPKMMDVAVPANMRQGLH